MLTYYLKCNNNTNNIGLKKVTMKNKVIRVKSRCPTCMTKKSRFLNIIKSGFSSNSSHCQVVLLVIIKHADILFKMLRNTENVDSKVLKTRNGTLMLSSKRAVCGGKKSRFMKEQEAEGLLSTLGLKTPLRKIPLLADILL